jgi:hypothetical protein
MEQMMEHLLAEIKTSEEEMKVIHERMEIQVVSLTFRMDTKKEKLVKMDTALKNNKEEKKAKIKADFNNGKTVFPTRFVQNGYKEDNLGDLVVT